MKKKTLQTSLILVIIGILITPANGFETLSTPITTEFGGTTLWTYTAPTGEILSVAVGDFNGDGTDDALAGGAFNRVYAINGTTGTQLWNYTEYGKMVAVGDFNGDGTDDAIAAIGSSIFNAINGATGELLWSYNLGTQINSIAVGDFNSDGVDDALTGGSVTNGSVYALNGTTGFPLLWTYTPPLPSDPIMSVAVGDFNGDGTDDAIAGSLLDVYAINGATGGNLWTNPDPGWWVNSLAVGDFNGDGVDDVLAGSSDHNVYAIDGITGAQLWNNTDPTGAIRSVAVGDFNGDGRDDALAGGDDTSVYAINGATGTLLWTYPAPTDLIWSVAVGDFNGDGINDALAGSWDSNVYAINGITGTPLWTYRTPTDEIHTVAVGDFNGDGVDDALAGSDDTNIYAIAGDAPPPTTLEVQLSVSKTYVNLTNDWTLARAVVTNVGSFTAYSVLVICHAPDGTDQTTYYNEIRPSRSRTATWNLTSGNGLPTIKVPNATQISYTIAVEVVAANGPTELVDVALIVDPPKESQRSPILSEGGFWVPVSIGVLVFVSYRKRRRNFSK